MEATLEFHMNTINSKLMDICWELQIIYATQTKWRIFLDTAKKQSSKDHTMKSLQVWNRKLQSILSEKSVNVSMPIDPNGDENVTGSLSNIDSFIRCS